MTITREFNWATRPVRAVVGIVLAAAGAQYSLGADKVNSTFNAYVDSDLCSRLMP
jgi:hypothetical protein